MNRIIRRIAFGVAGLVLLITVGIVFFVATFDPNQYREQIEAAVKKATGKQLHFEDPIEVAFFPKPGVRTGRLKLLAEPGFGPDALLELKEASMSVALNHLFDGVLVVEDVTLLGARLQLGRGRDGRGNWESTPQKVPKPDADGVTPLSAQDDAAPKAREASTGRRFETRLDSIKIKDLSVKYSDEATGASYSADVDSLELENIRPDADIVLRLAGRLSEEATAARVDFDLDALVRFNSASDIIADVNALSLAGSGFGKEQITFEGAAKINYEHAQGRLAIADISALLTLAQRGTNLKGNLNLQLADLGPALNGTLRLDDIDLDAWLANLRATDIRAEQTEYGGAPNMTRPKVERKAGASRSRPDPGAGPASLSSDYGKSRTKILVDPGVSVALALAVDSIKVEEVPLQQVEVTLRVQGGKVELPFKARIYSGTVEGTAKAVARDNGISATLACAMKNLNLGQATADRDKKYSVTGLFDASMDVAGQGADARAIMHSLKGKVSARAKGGEIRGFSLIPNDLPGLPQAPVDFSYTSMSASAVINEGTATSRDIALVASALTGRGGGVVRLAFRQADIGMNFMLAGLPPAVPVGISGPFNSLSTNIDMRTFLRNVAEAGIHAPEGAAKDLVKGVGDLLFKK